MKVELKAVDNAFQSFCCRPLVAGDVNAYMIQLQTNEPDAMLRVTAKRSDGKVFSSAGTANTDGTAQILLPAEMYQVPGELLLRISVVRGKESVTVRELFCTVLPDLQG